MASVNATPGQIEKIEIKYLPTSASLKDVRCAYDDEDEIYFISGTAFFDDTTHMGWQVRRGRPMFFGLTRDRTCYKVAYPAGALHDVLKEIGDKAIADWIAGNSL